MNTSILGITVALNLQLEQDLNGNLMALSS